MVLIFQNFAHRIREGFSYNAEKKIKTDDENKQSLSCLRIKNYKYFKGTGLFVTYK